MASIERTLSISEIEHTVEKIYRQTNLSAEETEILVESLLDAEFRGIKTHGLFRVKPYYKRIMSQVIRVPTRMEKINDRGAVSVFDGNDGLGQWIAFQSMNEAITKASSFGIGAVSVKNSQHFGTAGYYAKQATDQNMIGLVFTNASPRLAPWGGKDKLFGNNPWAIGVPTEDKEIPFVLDISNSVSSAGRVRKALANNEKIPREWALDEEGKLTTNPEKALRGMMLPFGQHKGYGITFAVSILSSLLSGGAFDMDVTPVDDNSRAQHVSHFFIAINIDFFKSIASFKEAMSEIISYIHSNGRLSDIETIYYPGERGYKEKAEILERGDILKESELWRDIVSLLDS